MLNNLIFHFGTKRNDKFLRYPLRFHKRRNRGYFCVTVVSDLHANQQKQYSVSTSVLVETEYKQYSVFTSVLAETEYTPSRPTITPHPRATTYYLSLGGQKANDLVVNGRTQERGLYKEHLQSKMKLVH